MVNDLRSADRGLRDIFLWRDSGRADFCRGKSESVGEINRGGDLLRSHACFTRVRDFIRNIRVYHRSFVSAVSGPLSDQFSSVWLVVEEALSG